MKMLMRIPLGIAAAVILTLAAIPAAQADIIFDLGNSPANQNIGSFDQNTATTATGFQLGTDDPIVDVRTDTDLTAPAMGAARVEAASSSALFTDILLTPTGSNFGILEFNLRLGEAGTFQLVALNQDGDSFTSTVFNLGAGENRVFAQAIGGQSISSVEVQVLTGGVGDIRQIRYDLAAAAVPEPSSLAIAGAGLLGLLAARGWRRRRQA